MLNSRELIWSRVMSEYLLGKRSKPDDLMTWNADTTRMPYRAGVCRRGGLGGRKFPGGGTAKPVSQFDLAGVFTPNHAVRP